MKKISIVIGILAIVAISWICIHVYNEQKEVAKKASQEIVMQAKSISVIVQAFYRNLETKDMAGIKKLLSDAEKNGMVNAPFYDKEFIVSDAATAPGSQWTFSVSPEKLENNLRVELPLVKDMVCDSLNSYVSERLNGKVGDLNSISCEKGHGKRGNVLVAVSTVVGLAKK